MKNKKNIRKFLFVFLTIFIISLLPIFKGNNIYRYVSINVNNPIKKLSAERQAVYDKMKINSLNIKERKTGTAPFNSGSSSNRDGVDVSDSDNYIRTFDTISYKLEVGVGPNTDVIGVSNSSLFNDGVIKVEAELPNQGDKTIMRWEKDVWMQNVTLSNDDTKITAEYYISNEESFTNIIQNLTFTVRVDGYKLEVTDDMKPTFKVWMEGNKEDNDESSAESLSIKDDKDIIISAHPSYDVELSAQSVSNQEQKNDIFGQYSQLTVGVSLRQDVNGFKDLRGIEYPKDKIDIEMLLEYSYKNSNNTYTKLNDINGTQLIAYNPNMYPEVYGSLHPKNVLHTNGWVLPFGKFNGNYLDKSVQDSGDIVGNLTGNKFTLSFENYKLNGKFPKQSAADPIYFPATTGYFAVANIQFFIPFYLDSSSNMLDGKLDFKIDKFSYTINSGDRISASVGSDGTVNDNVKINNKNTINVAMPDENPVMHLTSEIASFWNKPDAYVYDGRIFESAFQTGIDLYPYEGGTDSILVWNPKHLELVSYGNSIYYRLRQENLLGLSDYPTSNIKQHFGVYKANKDNGPQTIKEINNALFDDFDWYDSLEEAKTHGSVSGYFLEFREFKGRQHRVVIYNKFKAHVSEEDYGNTTIARGNVVAYKDAERTKAYYSEGYDKEDMFVPTQYNDNNIYKYELHNNLGETYLMIQAMTNSTTTVSDVDASGNPKKIYDVQEGEINVVVKPTLSDGKQASANDKTMNDVYVRTTLPEGLSYKDTSANKEPNSVILNSNGTTTIEWKYDDWQINHSVPDITFKAEISSSIENNKKLGIVTTTSAPYDIRDLDLYRTSKYEVAISNLLGVQAIKQSNKKVVDKNESFVITSTMINNSEEELSNIRGFEFLPGKDDSNESEFNGTYSIKVTELANGQKLYYTTKNREELNIAVDSFGKYTIKEEDLTNTERWTEVNVGDIIPSEATAIATTVSSIAASSRLNYKIEVTPTNNKATNIYAFFMDYTTNNTGLVVRTNTVAVRVVNRKISGIYFEDVNRNGAYDNEDNLLENKTIKLLDNDGKTITQVTTNENGRYEFEKLDKGTYVIEFSDHGNNYEIITKGNTETSSKANSNYKSDSINQTVTPTADNYIVDNINIGVRKKSAVVEVNHIYQDINRTFKTETINDKYFGDSYETNPTDEVTKNYELVSMPSNYKGTINNERITVNYYYKKKTSNLSLDSTIIGTEEINKSTDEVEYKITSTGTIEDYIGSGTTTITIKLPYEIDETRANLDGGTYNKNDKTITWTITNDINTYENKNNEINIEKTIKVVYKNLDPTKRSMDAKVTTNTILDNNNKLLTKTLTTNIAIKGKIKVFYVEKDEEGNNIDIIEPYTYEDLVGTEVNVEKEIDGYNAEPSNTIFTYQEEEQEVILVYEKKSYSIQAKAVNDGGGVINGEQTVKYNDNSESITIKSNEGYIIDSVTVNGEKISIKKNTKNYELVLEEVKENKNVEVSFKKITTNPNTGDNIIKFIVISLVSLATLLLIILIRKKALK